MVESSNFLIFLLVIAIGILIFYYRHSHYQKKIEKHTEMFDVPSDKMPNEDEFITTIADSHDTYDEFIRSSDFDNYFQYWKTHPKSVEKVKDIIENKKHKSFFRYKTIKY